MYQLIVNIEEKLTSCLIPSLMVQPLVENAIKHGIYDKEAEGKEEAALNFLKLGVSEDTVAQ